MMDNLDYAKLTRKQMLFGWGLVQMSRGAAYAAVFVLALGLGLWALYGVGLLLPAESRETPPPMGAVIMVLPTALV